MKTPRLFVMTIGAVLLGLQIPQASAQDAAPCPPFGWSEGLANYLKADAAFPTQDTANNPATDCAFHMWSWEAFVWATALDANGQTRFQNFSSPDSLGKKDLLKAGPRPLVLKPRKLKPRGTQQDIDEFEQAGPGGILVDQNGQALFYSVHMNPTYAEFVQKYYGVENYKKAAPTLPFPVGAAVFKAAWQIVPQGQKPAGAYTTAATVPMLVNNPKGGVMVDPSGATRQVTVALVGLHVVGVTVNHPEFLWGTFEQVQNSPSLADPSGYGSTTPVSNQNYTFYKAGTIAKDCNQLEKPSIADAAQQTLTPITNVFLQYQFGGASRGDIQEIGNITSQAQSAVKGMPAGEPVFANYALVGTVWLKPNTLAPNQGNLDQLAVGSVNLADSVMETFVQGPQNNSGTNASCFMCHNTSGFSNIPGKEINISHVILEPLFNSPAAKALKKKERK